MEEMKFLIQVNNENSSKWANTHSIQEGRMEPKAMMSKYETIHEHGLISIDG